MPSIGVPKLHRMRLFLFMITEKEQHSSMNEVKAAHPQKQKIIINIKRIRSMSK